MNKLILGAATAFILISNPTYAEDKKPDNEFSYNVAVSSDYRFRGVSQSRLQPALSGGADYVNNPTGFYLGTWASTIKWTKDAGGGGNLEIDIYGGKKGEIVKDVSYDVGVLSYLYPSNGLDPKAETTEIYGQIGYGPAYAKYSYGLTNIFGFVDSKRSGYLDLGANIDIATGTQLNLHLGHQTVRNNSDFNYTDYKVGVTKDFGVVSLSGAIIGTNNNNYVGPLPDAKNLGKTALVVSVSKTF